MKKLFLFFLAFQNTTTHSMLMLPHDIIKANIASHWNRIDRTRVQATNKKLRAIIMSQEELNNALEQAQITNNLYNIAHWRALGALNFHEELYKSIPLNNTQLALLIIAKHSQKLTNAHKKQALELARQ